MSISEIQRLENIAKTTLAVKRLTGMQTQPIAQGRSGNPSGTEVQAGDTIYKLDLQTNEISEYSAIYSDVIPE